jgi:acetyl-CoA carboxylase carboxyl transferase subunit alpha
MGGAHRDIEAMSSTLKEQLSSQLDELHSIPLDQLLAQRYERLMSYGNPS